MTDENTPRVTVSAEYILRIGEYESVKVFSVLSIKPGDDLDALRELAQQATTVLVYDTMDAAWEARREYLTRQGEASSVQQAVQREAEFTPTPTPKQKQQAQQQTQPPAPTASMKFTPGQEVGLVHRPIKKGDMVDGMVWEYQADEWYMDTKDGKTKVHFIDRTYHEKWAVFSVGVESKSFAEVFQGRTPKEEKTRYDFTPPLILQLKAALFEDGIVAFLTGAYRKGNQPTQKKAQQQDDDWGM